MPNPDTTPEVSRQTSQPRCDFSITEQGKLLARECTDNRTHVPHAWKSVIIEKDNPVIVEKTKGMPMNAWCEGTGIPPVYSNGTTYKPVPKVDYTEAVKDDGSPWREDFTTPIGVTEARKIAFHMHRNQKDKAGEPYPRHLEAVRLGVVVLGGDVDEQVAALFHDSEEDLHTTFALLYKMGVTARSLVIIEAVSKRLSEEQGKYLERIINAGKKGWVPKVLTDLGITDLTPGVSLAAAGAMRTKLADLLHNTRHDRLQALVTAGKQATVDRLLKKYRPAMARLMLELNMIVDEDAQKKLATKPAGSSYSSTTSYGTGTLPAMTQFEAHNLFPGDWRVGAPAPVLFKISEEPEAEKGKGIVTYMLCNGQAWEEEMKWSAKGARKRIGCYTKTKWESDSKITFAGVTEEQISDYIDMLNVEPKYTVETYCTALDEDPEDVAEAETEADDTYGLREVTVGKGSATVSTGTGSDRLSTTGQKALKDAGMDDVISDIENLDFSSWDNPLH